MRRTSMVARKGADKERGIKWRVDDIHIHILEDLLGRSH